MTEFNILADGSAWQADFEERLRGWYAACGYAADAVDRQLAQVRGRTAGATFAEITAGGGRIGYLAVDLRQKLCQVEDLWIDAEHAGRGHEEAALDWAAAWAAERGAAGLSVKVTAPLPLPAGYVLAGQTMLRHLSAVAEPPAGVTGRPMTGTEYGVWFDRECLRYAAVLREQKGLPEADALRQSEADCHALLPAGLDTPGHSLWVIEAAGVPVATNWLEHGQAEAMSWVYSIEVDENHRGRGYGRAAMGVGERAALAAGDSALGLNVFGSNEVARNLYTRMGYRIINQHWTRTFA